MYHYVAVSPGYQIGPHTQDSWELSLVVKGRGLRVIGDTSQPFADGDMVLIPPGIEHCWHFDHDHTDSEGNIVNITVMFPVSLPGHIARVLPEMAEGMAEIDSLRDALALDEHTRESIGKRLYELRAVHDAVKAVRLIEILYEISMHIAEASTVGREKVTDSVTARRMRIETFIACNSDRHIGIADVAAHVRMNKSSFCAFFRRIHGVTFVTHLNNLRLDRARDLLRSTDRHVSEICYGVGFQSVSHFNHLYRQRFGVSPRNDRCR